MLSGTIMKSKYKNKMNRLKTSNIPPQESGKTFPSSNCTNQREGRQVLNISNGWTNKGEMLEAAKSKTNMSFSKDLSFSNNKSNTKPTTIEMDKDELFVCKVQLHGLRSTIDSRQRAFKMDPLQSRV